MDITVGTVVRFRYHHPWNSWMDRWGACTVERIEPDRIWIRAKPYREDRPGDILFVRPDQIHPDAHDIVEGTSEFLDIPVCTVCNVALASHHYPRR